MKKVSISVSLLFLFVSFIALDSHAQSDKKKWSIGFGLEGGLPLGNAKTAFNFNGGLNLRFSYKAGPGFATFTTGANVFVPKSFNGVDTKAALQIPVKFGYRYKVVPHFFVMGELGYSSFRSYYDSGNGNLVSSMTGGFTYAPSLGTEFGAFELAARYEGIAVSGGTISFVALRLVFNF